MARLTPPKPRTPSHLAKIAFQMRVARGKTQQQFADILGLKQQSSIARMENGDQPMSWEQLKKLADSLNFKIDVIIFDKEN